MFLVKQTKLLLRSPFVAGVSGQLAVRILLGLSSAILVPLMISAWGVKGYGEWIEITSLLSYLGYATFGFVTPATNQIVMTAARGDVDVAHRLLRTGISFTVYIVGPILAVAVGALIALNLTQVLHLSTISARECTILIGASACEVFVQTLRGIMVAPLYAQGLYGRAYAVNGAIGVVQLVLISVLLLMWQVSVVAIGLATLTMSNVELVVVSYMAGRAAPWTSLVPMRIGRDWVREHIRPTFGFLSYNTSRQGIILQGSRVLLGVVAGGEILAVFSLYCTLMRLVSQFINMFVLPLEIEIARSAGRGNAHDTIGLIQSGAHGSWLAFSVLSCVLMIVSPFLFPVWTRGEVTYDTGMFLLAAGMFGAGQLGNVSAHALTAANRLYSISMFVIPWSATCVLIGAALALRFHAQGMFVGATLGEVGISIMAIFSVCRWLGVDAKDLLFDFGGTRNQLSSAWAYLRKRG